MAAKIRIGCRLGVTLQILGQDWIKPGVDADIQFDDIPSDQELTERWRWLWEQQVGPQADALLDLMKRELTKRIGPFRDLDAERGRQVTQSDESRTSPQVEDAY